MHTDILLFFFDMKQQIEHSLEINTSGDFSLDFPQFSDEGISDEDGNGEPSIVYRSKITAIPGEQSQPQLIGHTDQYDPSKGLNQDLTGIVLAKNLLTDFTVSCLSLNK